MTITNALVQGASRGIGLQFCRNLLARNALVVATCRHPEQAAELRNLEKEYGKNISILQLDVTKEEDVRKAAQHVQESNDGKLDLLINCAGMLHPSGRGETSLQGVSHEDLSATFSTNTIGPLIMAKFFGSMLKKGSGGFGKQNMEKGKQHNGILVNMSAKVGSIGDNALGGWYSYRMSKAALNMATKNLSIELGRGRNKVICVSLHPGTVDTDLSRPYHKGVPKDKLFSTEYSVNCLMEIIDGLDIHQTGKYYSWDGKEIPF